VWVLVLAQVVVLLERVLLVVVLEVVEQRVEFLPLCHVFWVSL
jgi:hypothetical protein